MEKEYLTKVPSQETLNNLCDNINSAKKSTQDCPIATPLTLLTLIKAGAEVRITRYSGLIKSVKVYLLLEYPECDKKLICFNSGKNGRKDVVYKVRQKSNCVITQLAVPEVVEGDTYYTDASYEDYCSVDRDQPKLTEDCWDSLLLDKYVCFDGKVSAKIAVFVTTPVVVHEGGMTVPIVTCILSSFSCSRKDKIREAICKIAREVYDMDYVRLLHKDDVCRLQDSDRNIMVSRPEDVDAFYGIV